MKETFLLIFFFTGFVYCQGFEMKVNLKNDLTKTFSIEDIKKISFGSVTGFNEDSKQDMLIAAFKLNQNYQNPFSHPQQSHTKFPGTQLPVLIFM